MVLFDANYFKKSGGDVCFMEGIQVAKPFPLPRRSWKGVCLVTLCQFVWVSAFGGQVLLPRFVKLEGLAPLLNGNIPGTVADCGTGW